MQSTLKIIKNRRKKKLLKNSIGKYELCTSYEVYANEKLNKTIEEFKASQFCLEFLSAIEDCQKLIDQECIGELICFGLGNFTESKAALHQLAALLIFCENYQAPVKIYDPNFSSFEIQVLQKLNFEVFSKNEEGKYEIAINFITLVFLPHCPKQLTNNFLWANWNIKLKNCILIANSFSKIILNNTKKVIEDSAYYISKILPRTKEIPIKENYCIENIFNDISIHCFAELDENFFLNSLHPEPVYFEDIEFVTKEVITLKIEND